MKGIKLCLSPFKLISRLMHFCLSGLYLLRRIAFVRCVTARRPIKAFGYGLLAVLFVAYSLFSGSSANVFAEPALPTENGNKTPDSAIVYAGQTTGVHNGYSCSSAIGEYLSCGAYLSASAGSGSYSISGFDLHFASMFAEGSIVTFTVQMHISDRGASQWEFNGFVANNSLQNEASILDQDVISVYNGEIIIEFTVYVGKGGTNTISLRGKDKKGVAIITNTATTNYVFANFSNASWVRVLTGSDLLSSLSAIDGSIKGTNDRLQTIINNGITANVDNSQVISQLQQSQQQAHTDAQNTQNAINNASSQAHQDSQAHTDAINQQTEQDKSQYEQDKQEEQDRENSMQDATNEAGGIFNFSVINPFAPIFALFKSPDSCATIPIISNWLNSDSVVYCSWWPSSVRSVLTPVFGISSIMLLFGFVVRWLGGSEQIDVGVVK